MPDEQPADQQAQDQSRELHDESYSGAAARQTLKRLGSPLLDFLKAETEGATALLLATAAALVWANVSGSSYHSFWTTDFSIRVGTHALSADLRHAKVYVSVVGTENEVKGSLVALRHASGFIRHQLGAVLRMRHTPELHFAHDDVEVRAARIEELLSEETAAARERDQTKPDQDSSGSGYADELG